jgi:hypothetical protein
VEGALRCGSNAGERYLLSGRVSLCDSFLVFEDDFAFTDTV